MEFASYQQAKIAINKFDGAMTKGETDTFISIDHVRQSLSDTGT